MVDTVRPFLYQLSGKLMLGPCELDSTFFVEWLTGFAKLELLTLERFGLQDRSMDVELLAN